MTNALGVASTAAGSSYYTRDNTGGLLAKRTSAGTPSATKYYLQDALGSVAALTSSTGSQTDPSTGKYVYDPFGNPRGTAPAEFGWQSAYRAPGGLVHFGYRYYDAYTGAWTQQDPINQASDLSQADRYTYAGGDPINAGDPEGLAASPCSPGAPSYAAPACAQLQSQSYYGDPIGDLYQGFKEFVKAIAEANFGDPSGNHYGQGPAPEPEDDFPTSREAP